MSQDIFETSNSMSGNLKKSIDTVNVQGFKIKQLYKSFLHIIQNKNIRI